MDRGTVREPLVAVTSRSFSGDGVLRDELLAAFPNCRFNEDGGRLDAEALVGFLSGAAGAIVGVERIEFHQERFAIGLLAADQRRTAAAEQIEQC